MILTDGPTFRWKWMKYPHPSLCFIPHAHGIFFENFLSNLCVFIIFHWKHNQVKMRRDTMIIVLMKLKTKCILKVNDVCGVSRWRLNLVDLNSTTVWLVSLQNKPLRRSVQFPNHISHPSLLNLIQFPNDRRSSVHVGSSIWTFRLYLYGDSLGHCIYFGNSHISNKWSNPIEMRSQIDSRSQTIDPYCVALSHV